MDSLNIDKIISKVDIGTKEVKKSDKKLTIRFPRKKKKTEKPAFDYRLGPRNGNTRIVDENAISTRRSSGRTNNENMSIGNLVNMMKENQIRNQRAEQVSQSADGFIGDSAQGRRGDCYFLASINSIRNTKAGQEHLQKNLHYNNDGSVTVTLPGAVKIRNEYSAQGKPCEVTGTYRISKAALQKAAGLAGDSYSKSDIEVIAYEIAMENYRAEMIATNKLNGNNQGDKHTAEGMLAGKNSQDILSGGWGYDARFLLTGEKSEVYRDDNKYKNPKKYYLDGEYGYITREEMANRTGADISMYNLKSAGISEVSYMTSDEAKLDKMLNQYEGHEGEYALTFDAITGKNGPDGVTKRGGGHELTVVKITGDTVYVANPWHPDRIEPIPRREFIQMATGFSATPVSENGRSQSDFQSTLSGFVQRINMQQFSGQANISPEVNIDSLQGLLNAHNHTTTGQQMDMNTVLRILSKASSPSANLSSNEKEQLQKFLNMFCGKNQTEIDPAILESLNKRFLEK